MYVNLVFAFVRWTSKGKIFGGNAMGTLEIIFNFLLCGAYVVHAYEKITDKWKGWAMLYFGIAVLFAATAVVNMIC